MMIIIILTASYIGDDVGIVYSLANTMRSFSVTEGRTDGGTDGQGDSRSRMYIKLTSQTTRIAIMFEI